MSGSKVLVKSFTVVGGEHFITARALHHALDEACRTALVSGISVLGNEVLTKVLGITEGKDLGAALTRELGASVSLVNELRAHTTDVNVLGALLLGGFKHIPLATVRQMTNLPALGTLVLFVLVVGFQAHRPNHVSRRLC